MAKLPTMKVEFPELARLMREFDQLKPSIARKHMGAAVRKCLKPGLDALRSTTPRGPTGNLRRAIDSKISKYRSGNVVGLVGYRKAGTGKAVPTKGSIQKGRDRAYHQKFLEYGTKDRYTKGSIASSYRRLGPFQITSAQARNARQGRRLVAQGQRLFARGARADAADARRGVFGPGRGGLLRSQGSAKIAKAGLKFGAAAAVKTSPAYPKAFFKRATKGQRVYLSSMPIGGSTGQPPVKTAYKIALPSMRALLPEEMAKALQKGFKDMADKFPPKTPRRAA